MPNQKLTGEEIKLLQDTLLVLKNYLVEILFEVRTPITTIKGYSELMLIDKMGPLTDEQRKSLKNINRQADFLLKNCNDLHEMSRMFSTAGELHVEEANVYELIEQAKIATWEHWRLAYYSEPSVNPVIRDEIPEELPAIWIDCSRVQQAITRLLVEAIAATSQTETAQIILSVSNDDSWITATVTAKDERVLFFQEHPNPRFFFAQTISNLHGGYLQIEKPKDTELILRMTLPIYQNKPED